MGAAAFWGDKSAWGPLKSLPLGLEALPSGDFFSLGFSFDFGQRPVGGKLFQLEGESPWRCRRIRVSYLLRVRNVAKQLREQLKEGV